MVREFYSYGKKYLIAIFQVDADLCSCCIPEIRDLCHERQLQGLERKAKVEGSQLRLYKAKEGSRKHEALHA
jgi:hypothetical protein